MNNPELYNHNNALSKRDALNYLYEYSNKIEWKDSARVIDIGCGDGSVTTEILKSFIPKNFTRLVGCDISEKMVRFADEHYGDDRTAFMIQDIAGDLSPELRGNFDHAFSFYTLHWVPDQEAAFRNIYELLTEGGDCLVTSLVGNVANLGAFRVLSRTTRWSSFLKGIDMDLIPPYNNLETFEPEKEVRRLMASIGFKNITVECKNLSYTFSGLDVYKSKLKRLTEAGFEASVSPFHIPEELQEEFIEEFLQVVEDFKSIRKDNNVKDDVDIKTNYNAIVAYGVK